MKIEEKYLELRKKYVNRKNNRYLFTYLENRPKSRLYIALLIKPEFYTIGTCKSKLRKHYNSKSNRLRQTKKLS